MAFNGIGIARRSARFPGCIARGSAIQEPPHAAQTGTCTPTRPPVAHQGGALPNSLGCSLGPFPFASAIKCHQKSTCNSAGSSVGSLLAPPPRATPRLGGAAVSCQYFPCSFVLTLREFGLRLGVKVPLPLRASSRGVLPGAGALVGYRTSIQPVCSNSARAAKSRSRLCTASWPCAGWPKLLPSPNEVTRDGVWACFRRTRKRKPTGTSVEKSSFVFFHRISNHKSPCSQGLSLTAAYVFPPPPAKRRAASDGRNLDTLACRVVGTLFVASVPFAWLGAARVGTTRATSATAVVKTLAFVSGVVVPTGCARAAAKQVVRRTTSKRRIRIWTRATDPPA
jgi:hypothetical protein